MESQQAAMNPLTADEHEISVMENIAKQAITPTNSERTGAAELSRKAHAALDMVHQLISNIQKTQRKLTVKVVDDIDIQLNSIRNSISSLAMQAEIPVIPTETIQEVVKSVTTAVLSKTMAQPPRTYAKMASVNANGPPVPTKKEQNVQPIIFKPTGQLQNHKVEEIKKIIKQKIPQGQNIKVKNYKETSNKNSIINVATEEDRAILEETIKNIPDLKILESRKKLPKIIIHGIEKTESEKEFLEEICTTNFHVKSTEEIKVRYKTGSKTTSKHCSWVVELPPSFWQIAVNNGRIFAGWRSYEVENYISVTRCFKCHRFGHTATYCKEEKETCFKCHGQHSTRDCSQESLKKCINCVRKGIKEVHHNTNDKQCPVYQRALEEELKRTDYGH